MAITDRELSKWKLEESEWVQIEEVQELLKVGTILVLLVIFSLYLLILFQRSFFVLHNTYH